MPPFAAVPKVQDLIAKYSYKNAPGNRAPTQTDIELAPYIEEEKQKVGAGRKLLEPLQAIFDLLQRGQYVTANVAQEFVDKAKDDDPLQIWQAVKDGITGKVKGDWEEVMFGDEGIRPWEPEKIPGKAVKTITGLLANILLDPTTYIGFGPAKAAKSGARAFSTDSARIALQKMGIDAAKIPELIQKGFDPAKLARLRGKAGKEGTQYLEKFISQDAARVITREMRDAYKHALRTPADQLGREMAGNVGGLRREAQDAIMGKYSVPAARSRAGAALTTPGGEVISKGKLSGLTGDLSRFEEGTGRLIDDILASPDRYAGSGTRAMRFMGKEFGEGVRNPAWVQAWDKAGQFLAKSPVGNAFSTAAWKMTGPGTKIGHIKEAFNIRNPYQEMLANVKLSGGPGLEHGITQGTRAIDSFTKGLGAKQEDEVIDLLMAYQGKAFDKIGRQQLQDSAPEVQKAVDGIISTAKGQHAKLEQYVSEGIINEVGDIENYMPIVRKTPLQKRMGTPKAGAGFIKKRTMGFEEHIEGQKDLMTWLFGISREEAERTVREGGGDIVMDLKQMLTERAIGQAKLDMRARMIREFKGFGIDGSLLPEKVLAEMERTGGLAKAGLRTIDEPALKGMLFDRDVAKMLELPAKLGSNNETLAAFSKAMGRYTSWIKSWLIASPGFHSRNFGSNNIMGALEHGADWFDMKNAFEATVTTVAGLYGREGAEKFFTKIGVPQHKMAQILGKKYNGKTLGELAEVAAERGVVSRATRGFDLEEMAERAAGALSGPGGAAKKVAAGFIPGGKHTQQFPLFKAGQELGTWIESVPRMQSFLINFKKLGAQNADNAIFDATVNAKKIFFDYSDLSPFEQKYMKQLIPFYTWMRKNVARQMHNVTRMADTYSIIPKLEASIKAQDIDEQDLPEWMGQLGYIPLNETLSDTAKDVLERIGVQTGEQRLAFWPNAPYAELNKIPLYFEMNENGIPIPRLREGKEVVQELMQSAHPTLKSIVELTTGVDVFYKTPIGETRKAPGIMGAVESVGGLGLIDGALKAVGHPGLDVERTDKGIMMDGATSKLLEENLPFLKQVSKWLDAPEQFIPVFDKFMESGLAIGDDYEGMEKALSTLSFYAGIKMKPLDIDKWLDEESEDILRAAEAARLKDKRRLPESQARSDEYWKNRVARRERLVGR